MALIQSILAALTTKAGAAATGVAVATASLTGAGVIDIAPDTDETTVEVEEAVEEDEEIALESEMTAEEEVIEEDDVEVPALAEDLLDDNETYDGPNPVGRLLGISPDEEGFGEAVSEAAREGGFGERVSEEARNNRDRGDDDSDADASTDTDDDEDMTVEDAELEASDADASDDAGTSRRPAHAGRG